MTPWFRIDYPPGALDNCPLQLAGGKDPEQLGQLSPKLSSAGRQDAERNRDGERGKGREEERENENENENCLVWDSRLFFQPVPSPAQFAPPQDGFEPMKNSFFFLN